MIRTSTLALLGSALVGVSAVGASGALIVSAGSTAPAVPSLPVAESNVVASPDATTWRNNTSPSNRRDYGQVFTASSSYVVDGVTVRAAPSGVNGALIGADAANASVTVEFFSVSGSTFTPLFSTTGTFPAGVSLGDYIEFDFPSSVETSLTGGQQYAFILNFDTAAAARSVGLATSTSSGYAGGQAVRRQPTLDLATDGGANRDLHFYVNRVIPEPTTLAGLATLGLLATRRRR